MATRIELPKFGNTVEECIVSKWIKRKGDSVSAGDIVAEIETDKTTFEVPTPVDGIVLDTLFEEGALVPVFTDLFVVGSVGERVDDAVRSARNSAGGSTTLGVAREHQEEVAQAGQVEIESGANATPVRSGTLSPRARRFAAEHAFNAPIVGSGPGGRVLEQDVRLAHDASIHQASIHQASTRTPIRTSSLRDTIGRRMRESLASTAQYTMHASADASGLLALRAGIKATRAAPDITINHLVAFATIQALLDTPALNAELVGGTIVEHSDVHLAFACDTPRGLVAPVIRNAHTLSVVELAQRLEQLAAHAIEGTVAAADLSGATFTISNLGALGIESFTPVINPPQVAILGVGAIQLKPRRRSAGTRHADAVGRGGALAEVEFVDAIGLSLTCDHQVIDGAPGARFLQTLTNKIESIESLCFFVKGA